jgi:hypothetical protein
VKKLLAVILVLMVFFAYMPHLSEAKGFGGSRGFTRHYSVPNHMYKSPYRNSSLGRSVMTHAAAFGLGAMVGHMFHPFGGYYGGSMYGFSFFGILIDVILILIIISIIKRLFRRRRY